MKLRLVDIIIICTYLTATIIVGLLLRKRAMLNKDHYLLGGKSIPWYLLGLSDASDMFDISGTMWMVALCFVYGLKSIWMPWLWPVFNQVFMMMFLSKWLRRSNATTGAEWLVTRFGKNDKSVKASHNIIVVFALLSCFGFLAYGFVGIGKFMEIFIPWNIVQPYIPFHVATPFIPHFYGIVFTFFALFYSILGGMHSIVLGDVIKYFIMVAGCIAVGIIAFVQLQHNTLNVPNGWYNPFFGWRLNDLDWNNILKAANKKINEDGYSLFTIFFMMMLFKGVFASLAGPAANYDMQKVLSTKSPKDAAKMSGLVSVALLPFRYALIIGLTVLALLHFKQIGLSTYSDNTDFEKILPATINNLLPVGVLGLVLTGLLGAFMSTFAGTVNAAQAYIVNDIYIKYVNPKAGNKRIISMNYIVGLLVVIIGIFLGFFVKNINSILQWIVGALYGGYIAANVLKWYWWRFNANGFFWGMFSGIAAALVFPYLQKVYPNLFASLDLYNWPLLFLISIAGCIIGTYTAPATNSNTLKYFYTTVKPWGFWKPVNDLVLKDDIAFAPNRNFKKDMFNVVLGIVAQCCLTLLPMYCILWMKTPLIIDVILLSVIFFILKRTWWNKLVQ